MTDRLFAAEAGSGAETIVFLHGFGGWHGVWRYVVERLADRYSTIAYDLPGHGQSLAVPGGGSAKANIAAIFADLDARRRGPVHIVGHSMGGAFAALAAIAEPSRFSSVTLFAPGGFGQEIAGPLLSRYARAVTFRQLWSFVGSMRGAFAVYDDPQLERLAAVRALPGQREALIDIHKRIVRDGRQGVIPRQQLAALSMPVAVAWGTGDAVLPVSQSVGLPPSFRVRLVPGAGHMLPETHPHLCASLIERNVTSPD